MASESGRRRSLIVLGVVLIVAGVVAAAAMWVTAASRRSDAIAGFARAPVGCDTTLDFVEPGEYLVYIESAGRIDGVRGDCDVAGEYDAGSGQLDAEVAVVDPDGEVVALEAVGSDVSYADEGFVGVAAFRVDIAKESDHVIRVESPDERTFAVAIGRDPDDGVAALRLGGLLAAVVGLVVGLAVIVIGSRRRRFASGNPPTWTPVPPPYPATFVPGQPPTAPPVYGRPQGPPPYGGVPPAAASTPPPPPAPTAPGDDRSWRPPPPPPPRSPTRPSIPGEPNLAPGPPRSIDDTAPDPERDDRSARADRPELPPPD